MVTVMLRSYFQPIHTLSPGADHRAAKGLNNRIEDSDRPTRPREKIMGHFKSQRQAPRFLAAHDQINTLFAPAVIALPLPHPATYGRTPTDGRTTMQLR